MCIPHTIYKQRRRRDGTSGRQIIIRNSKTSSAACDYYEIFICGIIKNNKSAVCFGQINWDATAVTVSLTHRLISRRNL